MDQDRRANKIVDERCACGHLRSEHADNLGGIARGHGPCCAETAETFPGSGVCSCRRFTWAGFVYEYGPLTDKAGQYLFDFMGHGS
jgi:hypothetical protein